MIIDLLDLGNDQEAEASKLTPADLGLTGDPGWSITSRMLRGGRREGVRVVRLDNGTLSVDLIPTRGMGIWKGESRGKPLGWSSPVTDGPIHPGFVNLAGLGGFGWLDGFDELLARCGMESNGPPVQDGPFAHGLHGRIQNIPAHRVSIEVDDDPPHTLSVTGEVDEARLFGPNLRMTSRFETTPGSNRLTVRDEFQNLGDRPTPLVMLYHWNLGPPLLGPGARLVAPIESVAPQTPRAAEGIDDFDTFGPPEPGFAEQVYLFKLLGRGVEGSTAVMLCNTSGDLGLVLRFSTAQLPCFTLWKNLMGEREGYVTGLEPATNYPNPRDFEREQGRFVELPPGGSHVAELTLEVLHSAEEVSRAEEEIQSIRADRAPEIHRSPRVPFSPTP